MIKSMLKSIANRLPFAVTRNIYYDRLTRKVIARVCLPKSNCIDVGCHKGEVMDLIRAAAPEGQHWGFEPLPHLFAGLQSKYAHTNCTVYNVALSNTTGSTTFNYVVSNPSYSGILKRQYDRPNEVDEEITVSTVRLDELVQTDQPIRLIKIDVEGAELMVLEGAQALLKRDHPYVIFEHGLGASEFYDATPERVYDLLTSCGYKVSLLDRFLQQKEGLTQAVFCQEFHSRSNYYFIAYV
jgi:FkbM family methyltransferase